MNEAPGGGRVRECHFPASFACRRSFVNRIRHMERGLGLRGKVISLIGAVKLEVPWDIRVVGCKSRAYDLG